MSLERRCRLNLLRASTSWLCAGAERDRDQQPAPGVFSELQLDIALLIWVRICLRGSSFHDGAVITAMTAFYCIGRVGESGSLGAAMRWRGGARRRNSRRVPPVKRLTVGMGRDLLYETVSRTMRVRISQNRG